LVLSEIEAEIDASFCRRGAQQVVDIMQTHAAAFTGGVDAESAVADNGT
jgi:hypothetical protein